MAYHNTQNLHSLSSKVSESPPQKVRRALQHITRIKGPFSRDTIFPGSPWKLLRNTAFPVLPLIPRVPGPIQPFFIS